MSQIVWQNWKRTRFSTKKKTRIIIPVFSISGVTGVTDTLSSMIVTTFIPTGITLPDKFTINMPVNPPDNPNFCLAIRWEDLDGNVFRYKLWEGIGEVLDYDLYNGESIYSATFVVEIWTIDSDVVSITEEFPLKTGILVDPDTCCQNMDDDFVDYNLTEDSDIFTADYDFPYVFDTALIP